jgi:hypothetical protein
MSIDFRLHGHDNRRGIGSRLDSWSEMLLNNHPEKKKKDESGAKKKKKKRWAGIGGVEVRT